MRGKRNLICGVLFAMALVASGVAHGRWVGRWVPLPPLDAYVERLSALPATCGDWIGTDQPLDVDELKRVGIAGHSYRHFRNRRTGQVVGLLVVCGRSGPISVHTPDVCYRSAGYQAVAEPDRITVPGRNTANSSRWWSARFRPPPGPASQDLTISWAWVGSHGVDAPDSPRLSLAGEPALYKIYAVCPHAPGGAGTPTAAFLSEYLSPLEDALVGPPATASNR